MDDEEIIQYFANLIGVTATDGQLAPAETAALEKLRNSAKLTKKQFRAAEDRAAASGFAPTPVGRFSDTVRNFEEMLELALCDGPLTDAERSVVESFSTRCGLTGQQFSRLLSETEARFATPSTVTCSQCGAQVSKEVRFCSGCGAAMTPPGVCLDSIEGPLAPYADVDGLHCADAPAPPAAANSAGAGRTSELRTPKYGPADPHTGCLSRPPIAP